MSENEKKLYGDFLSHQKAANEYVKKIDELQHELEEASFERDSIMQDAMKAGFMGPSVTNASNKKKREKIEASSTDVVGDAIKNNKPGSELAHGQDDGVPRQAAQASRERSGKKRIHRKVA